MTEHPLSIQDRFDQIVAQISPGRHRHIALFIGSAASYAPPTRCASIWQLRNEMVLRPLLKHVREEVVRGTFAQATLSLLERICGERSVQNEEVPLTRDIEALPFERFMGCLHKANRIIADDFVNIAYGSQFHGRPNHNHVAASLLGRCLLENGLAERISILTTNYDVALERAICTTLTRAGELKPISGIDDIVPALCASMSSGRSLQLVKLHGCIERGRLVYAFSQMGRLVFEPERLLQILPTLSTGTTFPTLYLTIGYSFSDPDLRPMFLDAFSRVTPLVFRNEQPPHATSAPPHVLPKEIARAGPTILREEFLAKATGTLGQESLITHHSDLNYKQGAEAQVSLLVRLAKHFCNADFPVEDEGVDKAADESRTKTLIRRLGEPEILVFLGGLVDACARSDALGALEGGLTKPSGRNVLGEVSKLYLSQYGHAHRMVEAARACVQLRRQHHELEVRLIAGAYRSFALSIGPGGPLRVNQLRASLPLFRVRPIRKRVGPALQLFYQHYALHYWTKVGEIAAQVLSSLFGSLGVWAGRIALERCAERLEACLETALALEVPDLEAAADVESLHAEVRTILRQEAVSLAERNRQIRAALGTLNRVALVDRQLGWAYLSEDTNQRREDAIRAFARGLWLSTYSWDGSIEPKLAADLVRALHSKQAKELDNLREGSACEGSACDEKSAVLDTCRQVGLGERPVCDLIAEDCRRMLVRHLRFLYAPDDTKILERISRLTDTARYPIFLAPDPPAAAIERRRRCRNHAETSPSDSAP